MYKGVTRIQADTNSRFVVNESNDIPKVFKSRPNDVSTAGHVFKQRFHRRSCSVGTVKGVGYASDSFVAWTTKS
jgi:hypothetical protein